MTGARVDIDYIIRVSVTICTSWALILIWRFIWLSKILYTIVILLTKS